MLRLRVEEVARVLTPEGRYRKAWIPEAAMRELCNGLFDAERVVKNFYFYQDMFVMRRTWRSTGSMLMRLEPRERILILPADAD